jgi:CubicO group peptidase (beta-lactamase class C family)
MSLIPLPSQPADTEWPTREWPEGGVPEGVDGAALDALLHAACDDPQPAGSSRTHDLLVVHRGRIVAERYAPEFGPADTQPSWSMAKSILHAVVGILSGEGRLQGMAPAAVQQWQQPGDRRAAITLDSLLHMTSGLHFTEDYVHDTISDVIKMLLPTSSRASSKRS